MTFGISNIGKPAPAWMNTVFTALIMVFMPAVATFVIAIPSDWVSADIKNFIGAVSTFVVAILRGIMMLFGETPPAAVNS